MAKGSSFFDPRSRVQAKKHPGVKSDDVLSFFEHMSTLLNAGVPLLRALTLATEQTESVNFQKALRDVTKKVSGGSSFYEAAAAYPQYFPNQAIQVIRTGEQSGQIAPLLAQLNISFKKHAAVAGKVKSALIYPSIMMSVAVAAIVIMLWKVIPTFAQFFQDFGKKLPAITQLVLNASSFLQHYGIYLVLGITAFVFAVRAYNKTESGSRQLIAMAMAMPLVGELLVQSAMEAFSSNMALLMKSGMPMMEALDSTQKSFNENPVYRDALGMIYHRVSTGSDLGSAMQATGLFTNLTVGMVKMGEESGKLSDVLDVVAVYYADKVELMTLRLTSLMEPVIVIGMGVVVAFMLGSVYLPMFQLSGG
ncbi:MAG: type II secretion system F family protein [Elusimicrobiales bacterium]|nr:type II secretion system F family protein [Elusimicrobiales bacterium]